MPRRSVYLPDPPALKKRRSSFARSELPWDHTPTPSPALVDAAVLSPPAEPSQQAEPVERQPQPTSVGRQAPSPPAPMPAAPLVGAEPAQVPEPRPDVPRWILQVRDLDLLEIAEVLGLEVDEDRIRPCPRCGEEAGAEVYRNKKGWTVWRCRACSTWDRGNLDLASYAFTGEKAGDLPTDQKALLQQWFADQGWCEPVQGEDEDRPVP